MTKQQKARAHLARAQELIQDTLAFGVEMTEDQDSIAKSAYDKLPLSEIARRIDDAGIIRAFRAVNNMHHRITEEMFEKRAKDDQFLIDALQKQQVFIASKLIQHRANTDQKPSIPKNMMMIITQGRNWRASYGCIIELILEGALNRGRPIELTLNRVCHPTSQQHETIRLSINNFRKTAIIFGKEFDGKDDKDQAFVVKLVHERTYIRYTATNQGSGDWHYYDGVLKLG